MRNITDEKINKMKQYILPKVIRGIQVHLICNAKNMSEAAIKFDVSPYYVKVWASKSDVKKEYDGVHAYMDSGYIVFECNRKDLYKTTMPIAEMTQIIQEYQTKRYAK